MPKGHGDSSDSLIPEGQLPSYLAEAFSELYAEDGLLVLGKGLGLLSLVASFVRFYGDKEEGYASFQETPTKSPLVFVIGLREPEAKCLINMLTMWGTPPDLLPTMVTNESGQGKDRAVMYSSGGVFIITTRILIVDLLTNCANAKFIDGILVAHAENVTEQSTEAFILRIFRTQKRLVNATSDSQNPGFVKAFSDSPGSLMSGFAKVDKILKALHVRHLFLFPRFHTVVADELDRTPPHVDELHLELSPSMKEIQVSIAVAVKTCIREIKASTSVVEWTDADLSIENCVTENFLIAINRQLQPEWHRLKPQTKQLAQDLKQLCTLFQSLIQYDCVAFWKLINSIKSLSASSRHPSMWLLTPAAEMIFKKAKERVYVITKPLPTSKVPDPVSKLTPVLEESPKWRALRNLLAEIKQDFEEKKSNHDSRRSSNNTVLIMVKDERTLDTIKSYLVEGKGRTLTKRWFRFLENYNDRSRSVTKDAGGTRSISEESRLLLEEESRARGVVFGRQDGSSSGKRRTLNQLPEYTKRRRRVALEKGRGKETAQSDDLERNAVLDEAVEETEHALGTDDGVNVKVAGSKENQHMSKDQLSYDSDDDYDRLFRVSPMHELKVVLRSYSSIGGDEASLLLQDIRPSHVVLYDSDTTFIRSIEIYSSLQGNEEDRLHIYFLQFEASAEEKIFKKSLEREKSSFERLIHHKKSMPLPTYTLAGTTQEMQQAMLHEGVVGTYSGGTLPLSADTRTGRGKSKAAVPRCIAVDVREFRSALPSILHQGGMRLAPVTLTVGDFVLSNVHCVERKSISDLFGSFSSGRLYTQAEGMSKYYKCPCLLIEFDPLKSFSLQNSNELGVEIRTDSICSKMVLLTMHFPKLRILWCRGPHETLRIFSALKLNHGEVDVDKAVEIGRNDLGDLLNEDHDEVNEAGRDMLLRLPGVNAHNARKIMSHCDSVAELAQMSRGELRKIAGPVTGQKLFTFFHQKIAAT